MKLFDIVQEYQALKEILENDCEYDEETGEITDNSLIIQEMFNGLTLSLQTKLDNSAYVLKGLEWTAEMLKEEAKRLNERARSILNNSEKLKTLMLMAVNEAGGKVSTDKFTFSNRKSESVIVNDANLLEDCFIRTKIEADKVAIKSALKNGLLVNGAELSINNSLQIK